MDIEAVKARCAAATEGPWHWPDGTGIWAENAKRYVSELPNLAYGDGQFIAHARTDLPDAIELIEEAEDLLLDARPVVGGDAEMNWCKRREAFFAKMGSTKKSP